MAVAEDGTAWTVRDMVREDVLEQLHVLMWQIALHRRRIVVRRRGSGKGAEPLQAVSGGHGDIAAGTGCWEQW